MELLDEFRKIMREGILHVTQLFDLLFKKKRSNNTIVYCLNNFNITEIVTIIQTTPTAYSLLSCKTISYSWQQLQILSYP